MNNYSLRFVSSALITAKAEGKEGQSVKPKEERKMRSPLIYCSNYYHLNEAKRETQTSKHMYIIQRVEIKKSRVDKYF